MFARGDLLCTTSVHASPGDEKLLVSNGDAPTWGGPDILPQQTLAVSLAGKGSGTVTGYRGPTYGGVARPLPAPDRRSPPTGGSDWPSAEPHAGGS